LIVTLYFSTSVCVASGVFAINPPFLFLGTIGIQAVSDFFGLFSNYFRLGDRLSQSGTTSKHPIKSPIRLYTRYMRRTKRPKPSKRTMLGERMKAYFDYSRRWSARSVILKDIWSILRREKCQCNRLRSYPEAEDGDQ
jgi:hypothetical protein